MIVKRWLNRAKQAYKTRLFRKVAEVGEGTVISYNASVSAAPGSVRIGTHCHISGSVMTRGKGNVIIGSNVFIGGATVLGALDRVTVGNDVIISNNVHIYDNNNHPTDPEQRRAMTQSHDFHGPLWSWEHAASAPVVIGDNVWIGEHSSILKGVTVGEGSIIGARAVVTRDVPPYSVAAGNPAKVVKSLKQE